MKNAFGYARVSGSGQVEADGFKRQTQAINQYCEQHDLNRLQIFYEEAIPGKTEMTDRPAFMEMVQQFFEDECSIVIVESLDRLARSFSIQEQLLTYLASKDIQLISANTGENVTEALMGDPMRRALVQIQSVFHELDKNLIVSKLMKARKRARDRGERCEGQPPFGFKTVKEKGQPVRLEEVPREQEIIRIVRAQYSYGHSLTTIVKFLNESSFRPRRGKSWHPMSVKRILDRPQTPTEVSKCL